MTITCASKVSKNCCQTSISVAEIQVLWMLKQFERLHCWFLAVDRQPWIRLQRNGYLLRISTGSSNGITNETGLWKVPQLLTDKQRECQQCSNSWQKNKSHSFCSHVNPLTPNDHYSGCTAPLTSKVAFYIFIQQIKVLNILNIVYTLRFFPFKMQFVS